MAGHSKWAKVKHKKAITDARKSKVFSKLLRYISVEAIVVSKGNISSLREEYGDIPESFVSDNSTTVMLILDNHQLDLSSFDYESMAELNGEKAKEWFLLSGEMGGHHASGLLTFSKQENPLKLSIAGLPVGALTVKLTRTE